MLSLLILFGAVALVLLIACVGVAGINQWLIGHIDWLGTAA